jgi:uncharacterized protein (TIGR03437 family)
MRVTPQGELLLAGGTLGVLFRVGTDGQGRVFAGNGFRGFGGEGDQTINAAFAFPSGVLEDDRGNVYVADTENHRVRRIDPNGIVTTIAGTGANAFAGDGGPALRASLSFPTGMAFDNSGNLFIADSGNDRIRRISPDGIIATIAGVGRREFCGDNGRAVNACLSDPKGLIFDRAGNLFVADRGNNRVRRITGFGVITTYAGSGQAGFSGDGGSATEAMLNNPSGVAIAGDGSLLVADRFNHRIRRVTVSGIITTIAGTGVLGFNGDGLAPAESNISEPLDIGVDGRGAIFVVEAGIKRIRRIGADGRVSTAAGNGEGRFSGDGDQGLRAVFDVPLGLAVDRDGNLFFADTANHRVRRIGRDGLITTIAGTGQAGFSGDGGPAINARFQFPQGVSVDGQGNLFIADRANHRIRRISAGGVITTIAGNGVQAYSTGNGQALAASMNHPSDVAAAPDGSVYVADTGNHVVRRVLPNGAITIVAGTAKLGYSGDGGPAVLAQVYEPVGLSFDPVGGLIITDTGNHVIRRVDTAGRIQTIAGNTQIAFRGDGGPALQASFNYPLKAIYDKSGALFVTDSENNRIRVVLPNGIIETAAGTGEQAYFGDGGPARSAGLSLPAYLAIDFAGNIIFSDAQNNRLRALIAEPPRLSASPLQFAFQATSGGPATAEQSIAVDATLAGVQFTTSVLTASGGNWLSADLALGTLPATLKASANPAALAPGQYTGTIELTAAGTNPGKLQIDVLLDVEEGLPARLETDSASVGLLARRGAGPVSQRLKLRNTGGGIPEFQVSTATDSGGPWLTVSPESGRTVGGVVDITLRGDPSGLETGTYRGAVVVVSGDTGQVISIPVTFTVTPPEASIRLSQTGLPFTGVAGGGPVPPQRFEVLNRGVGSLNWTARVTTFDGGNWLLLSSTAGTSVAGAPGIPVQARVDTTGLEAKEYFGQIEVQSDGASNSPQVISVALNLLPAGTPLGPVLSPAGLVFTGVAGDSSPGSQEVQIFNSALSALTFVSGVTSEGRRTYVNLQPSQGSVGLATPQSLIVQPDTRGFGAGVYRGAVTLIFSDGSYRLLPVVLILKPQPQTSGRTADSECAPTRLVPLFTTIPQDFSLPVAWPVPVELRVLDDCANPVDDGSTLISFSNGDVPLALTPLLNGRWSGTYFSRVPPASPLIITADAEQTAGALRGRIAVSGGMRPYDTPPLLTREGVVSTSSYAPAEPLAPGSLVSLFGLRLSNFQETFQQLPLPQRLGDTEILLGGRRLPLLLATDRQINAILPMSLPTNTELPLVVRRGRVQSTPDMVKISSASPGIFSSEGTGQGVALAYVRTENGSLVRVTDERRVAPGEKVVLQCSGLGRTSPALTSGEVVPEGEYRTELGVTVILNGNEFETEYAGLQPGVVGVYQVQFTMPESLTGDVEIKVRSGGANSRAVILPAR